MKLALQLHEEAAKNVCIRVCAAVMHGACAASDRTGGWVMGAVDQGGGPLFEGADHSPRRCIGRSETHEMSLVKGMWPCRAVCLPRALPAL